jgi:hypothetical protein
MLPLTTAFSRMTPLTIRATSRFLWACRGSTVPVEQQKRREGRGVVWKRQGIIYGGSISLEYSTTALSCIGW